MGVPFYCSNHKCDMGFDWPTAREDLIDPPTCVKCGTVQPTERWRSLKEWVADIDERLRAIEGAQP